MNTKWISVDPDICNGQPVIKGTRITVQTVLEFLGAGDSIEDILEEYPSLTRQHMLGVSNCELRSEIPNSTFF